MYSISEKTKLKIIKDCFDDACEDARKEESGVIRALANSVAKANIFFDQDASVAVVGSKQELSINYIYKLSKTSRRIQIFNKIDAPYVFEIQLNGEIIKLECNQYACRCLE